MSRLRAVLRSRTLLAAFAFVGISVGMNSAFESPSSARPMPAHWGYIDIYYTDGSSFEQCGFYNACTGERVGCRTPYRETEVIPCS